MDHDKFEQYLKRAHASVYAEPAEGNFHAQLIPQMAHEYFEKLALPKDSYILDVGCGQGQFLRIAQDLGYCNAFGVTMGEEDFAACQPLEVVMCDMADIPYEAAHFDFIWCRHALEHSPFPLFALYEFERLLAPGGQAFIEVPSPDCRRQHEFNANHYSIMGALMWQSLIAKAGMKVQTIAQFSCDVSQRDNPAERWRENSLCIRVEKPRKEKA